MPKELTTEQIRDLFLDQVRVMVNYWSNLPDKSEKEKLEGLAFSILTILDGGTTLPGFIVAPITDPEDKEYHITEGEDYYPENHHIEDKIKGDIAGALHEHFFKK